jgi:LuxR family maltose regulon positive regulatory protein
LSLSQAIGLYQETIDYGLTQNEGRPFPPAGYAYAGLGQVMYEQNDLASAERHLTQAVELGRLMTDWSMTRRGLLPLAWLKQMQGDSAGAQALWQQALSVVQKAESKRVEVQLEAYRARLWLAQARMPANQSALASAADWAEKYQYNQPDIGSYSEALAQITLTWVELAQGQTDQALTRLETLAKVAAAGGQIDNLINILGYQALAQAAQDDLDTAINTLSRAIGLAAPEGYVRTFVDHGPPMRQLLQHAAVRDLAPDYISSLLAAFSDSPEDKQLQNSIPKIQALAEPLKERELSIVRLMAAGLSNREIAEELCLSINTVKWYTTHIYGKLNVKKRAEAVDRAHALGIL